MIVYGSTLSPFVRKVAVFGAEKGITFEMRPGGMGRGGAEFEAISPFGKIPALRDGDFAISDSSAIVHYLEAKQPEPALIPAQAQARAQVIWFDEFADTVLFPVAFKVYFNRVLGPLLLKMPSDEAVAAQAVRDELPPKLAYLESVLGDEGYLVGDALTLADIAVASVFVNLAYAGEPVDAGSYPRLAAWVARIHARTSFAALIAAETAMMARARG